MKQLGGLRGATAAAVATVAAVVVAGVAGCSQHTIDEAAWQKAEANAGVTITDWAKWKKTALETCKDDDVSYVVAAVLDGKTVPLRAIEINYDQACPDRKDVFEKAVADNKKASESVKDVCSTPANARTQKQQQLAEAMGCA